MQDGSVKAIETVKEGDLLQGSGKPNKVLKTMIFDHEGWLYSMNGSKYFVTEAHPFMTKEGVWKAFSPEAARKATPGLVIEQLKKGDVLITKDGEVRLSEVDRVWKKTNVYNFTVDNTHDYYANGYLVHNKDACGGGYSCPNPNDYCDGSTCWPGSTGPACM